MMKTYIGTKIINAEPQTAINGDEGFRVVYQDGYTSWSPSKAFEEAYRETSGMPFGLALEALKKGLAVRRAGWNGKGLTLKLQAPEQSSTMTLPYIYMQYPATPASESAPANHISARVPWLASQTDMMADDWMIVEAE